jgi:hypothetical protein
MPLRRCIRTSRQAPHNQADAEVAIQDALGEQDEMLFEARMLAGRLSPAEAAFF